jgi:hypothetical protein
MGDGITAVGSGCNVNAFTPDVKNVMQSVGDAARTLKAAQAAGDVAGIKSAATALSSAVSKMGMCKDASVADGIAQTGKVSASDQTTIDRLSKFGTPKPVTQTQAAAKPINYGYSNVSSFA